MKTETLVYAWDGYKVPLWKTRDSRWMIDNDSLARKLNLFGRSSSNLNDMLSLIKSAIDQARKTY